MNARETVQRILDQVNARPLKVRVQDPTPEGMVWACYAEDGSAAAGVAESGRCFTVHGATDMGASVLTDFHYESDNRGPVLGAAIRWAVRWTKREGVTR